MFSTTPLPHAVTHYFEKQIHEAELEFREEQKKATDLLLKRQRQAMLQALHKALAEPRGKEKNIDAVDAHSSLNKTYHPLSLQPKKTRSIQKESKTDLIGKDVDDDASRGSLDEDSEVDLESVASDIKPTNKVQRCLLPIVTNQWFEGITMACVVLYSFLLGVQVHLDMTEALGTKANIWGWLIHRVNWVMAFLIWLYLLEMVMRLAAEQREFFTGKNWKWNIFDMIILFVSLMDIIVAILPKNEDAIEILSRFRVMRILRFFRNFRIITVFKVFTDLRVMLWSIIVCLDSFCWAMMLILVFFYICAVFLEDSAAVQLKRMERDAPIGTDQYTRMVEVRDGLREHWDGMYRGMLSLVFAISGGEDWSHIGAPFFEMSRFYGVIFTAMILVSLFGIMNVLVGIFVQKAGQIESWDRELALDNTEMEHNKRMETFESLFNRIDEDGSGTINLEELKNRLSGPNSDERIQTYFRHLGIDIDSAAHDILATLDINDDGVLSLEEFKAGCRKCQGNARGAQLEQVLHKLEHLERIMDPEAATRRELQITGSFEIPRLTTRSSTGGIAASFPSPKYSSRSFIENP